MATQGGYGVHLKVAGTAVAHIMDLEFPEFEKIISDVTAHDSPGGYAEYTASGLRKMNTFKITLLWDAVGTPTHAALVDAFESDNTVALVLADPDNIETITVNGHVTKIGRVTKKEEGYTCDVEIQPTGIPVIT